MNAFQALSDWFFSLQIYLPIAEVSLNVVVLLAIGGGVGLLSGLFGVGGGFLMTPLLIFIGVPPAVAVATQSNQVVAASVSGVLAHWSRDNVDFKMGGVLLAGGVLGSSLGVIAFSLLKRFGQIDLVIAIAYVVTLGSVGTMMAIESVNASGEVAGMLELADGALATSGDARRFLLKDGVRYGHILNPRTGKPVDHAPRSVTVAAATCVEAGMIATLAVLQGKGAEAFLKHEGARAWCIR